MLDALCRRAPEVASARRVAERCMVLLVVGNNVEIYSLAGGWQWAKRQRPRDETPLLL